MQTSQPPTTKELNELFTQACDAQQNKNLADAKEKYLLLLQYVPEAPILLYNLGLLYFEQHEYEEAQKIFVKALELAPEDPDILFNLALSQKRCGDIKSAISAYNKLLSLEKNDIDSLYNLGGCYKDIGMHSEAVATYLKVLKQNPDHISANNNLAYVFQYLGDTDQAIYHFKKVLDSNPDHTGAGHMYNALTGKKSKNTPDLYVKDLFDSYSRTYDQSLVNTLKYSVPEEIIKQYFEFNWHKSKFDRGLDLGCGTGLCGEKFAELVTVFDGVDISSKMVELARAKKIYHSLAAESVVNYLQKNMAMYDLFIAADVFGYVGDLSELFSLIKKRSCSDSLFCFSTETEDVEDFILRTTGRFAHSPSYIKKIANISGWKTVSAKPSSLRKERGEWVEGMIWFLTPQQ